MGLSGAVEGGLQGAGPPHSGTRAHVSPHPRVFQPRPPPSPSPLLLPPSSSRLLPGEVGFASDVFTTPPFAEAESRRVADSLYLADVLFQLGGELALRVVRYAHVDTLMLGGCGWVVRV